MGAISTFPAGIGDRRSRVRLAAWDIQGIFDDGLRHHLAGRIDEAAALYQRAISLNPNYAGPHYNLGIALGEQGRIAEAVAHYRRAVTLKPDYAEAHNNLGVALLAQGHIDNANVDGAVEHFERALAINPRHAEAHNNLGNVFREHGSFDRAVAHYDRAIAIDPDSAEAHFHRAEIKVFRPGDADLAALETLARRDHMPAHKAPFVHFALAKALEDSGDCVRAFEHLRKGNDLKRRLIDYDEPAVVRTFERIAALFDSRLLERFEGCGDPTRVPIFVLGMPRSGSTLIERILAAHPQIHAAGELTLLESASCSVLTAGNPDGPALRRIGQRYLASLPALAADKVRIVDKLPGNFLYVGLLRMILPNARIIHTVRDPIDTCVSCYSKLFASGQYFSYDMAELGRYYRRYRELMAHWRRVLPPNAILDVAYEDVVDDIEEQARRLIDHCGLPWDDRCLSFNTTMGPVKTASAVQVRKPLFRTSLNRWRRFEPFIGPLLRELGNAASGD